MILEHRSLHPMANQLPMNGSPHPNPHFVLVPLFAQGHMIPMIDMARLIANRGALVTFITTPANAARIKPIIDRVTTSGLPIRFVELEFPCREANLPDGCENIDLIPSPNLFKPFFDVSNLLADPLQSYLTDLEPQPSCMIADFGQPWTAEVARNLNIPRLIFHGPSALFLLCTQNIQVHNVYDTVLDPFEPFVVPDLPQKIETTRAQAPGWFDIPGWETMRKSVLEAQATADGFVVNTFHELEAEFIDCYKKAMGGKVWTIGPLSLYNKDAEDKTTRGDKAAVDEHRILRWLDSMAPTSVIFVNFGSLVRNGPSQVFEIGSALEASNRPFIWVMKEGEKCAAVEKWMSEGFVERTRERGLIITGWAPQVLILSHPSIGGFVTHCGWNSILEAVSAGVPMITWPHFTDQFLNEKLVVEILGIGVATGTKMPVYGMEDDQVMVKREDLMKAVVELMDGGEEGEERRRRAKELKEKAWKAMEEGGLSYENLTHLIQFFSEQGNKKLQEEL